MAYTKTIAHHNVSESGKYSPFLRSLKYFTAVILTMIFIVNNQNVDPWTCQNKNIHFTMMTTFFDLRLGTPPPNLRDEKMTLVSSLRLSIL